MATNQNVLQLTQQTVSANTSSVFYAVTGGVIDTGLPFSVFVNNLGLTGVPTVPTASTGTNTLQIANCAFVQNQLAATVVGTYAPLASPAFSGTISGAAAITLSGAASFTSLNSTPVGNTAASTGSFTTLTASSTITWNGNTTFNGSITGTGISNYIQTFLASPTAIGSTAASTGKFTTLQSTGTFTPSTTSGIVGTTAADSAQAGSVGEVIPASASAVSLTNSISTNITSVNLTAGDWDVWGHIKINPGSGASTSVLSGGLSTTSSTLPASINVAQLAFAGTTNFGQSITPPPQRINVSTLTTVYLVTNIGFTGGTTTADGVITARRRR